MVGANERLGESLRRAPYVWLIATILLLLFLNSGLARIASSPGHGSTALAIAGVALGAAGTASWMLLQAERVRRGMPPTTFVLARWAFATTPFFFAYCAVAAGGEQWAFFFGFFASVALLVISARRTKQQDIGSTTP